VQRLMQKHGIQARGKRKFRVTTTDSRHSLPIAPNVLDRNFTVAAPNMAWVGDFTYIATEQGWLFLAVVVDLFSRKVVGWSMQPDMQRSLVIDALEMAWFSRSPGKKAGLIFQRDQCLLSAHSYHGKYARQGIQIDPLHRRLRQLRYLHRCFDCYRVERTSSRAGLTPAVD